MSTPDPRPSPAPSGSSRRALGEVAGAVAADLSLLAQQRAGLAKATKRGPRAQASDSAAGLFAGAGVLGYFALFVLLIAAAEGLVALGLPRWVSYLIVTFTLLLVAAVLALVGRRWLSDIAVLPRTRMSMDRTTAALSGRSGDGGKA